MTDGGFSETVIQPSDNGAANKAIAKSIKRSHDDFGNAASMTEPHTTADANAKAFALNFMITSLAVTRMARINKKVISEDTGHNAERTQRTDRVRKVIITIITGGMCAAESRLVCICLYDCLMIVATTTNRLWRRVGDFIVTCDEISPSRKPCLDRAFFAARRPILAMRHSSRSRSSFHNLKNYNAISS
jgi:hypothetical protein